MIEKPRDRDAASPGGGDSVGEREDYWPGEGSTAGEDRPGERVDDAEKGDGCWGKCVKGWRGQRASGRGDVRRLRGCTSAIVEDE